MPNLLLVLSQKRLELSWEIRPAVEAKRTEPEVIEEMYKLVVEAVPETVMAVVEAYGKVEA